MVLESNVHPVLGAYVLILFTSSPKAASYLQVLSSGYPKSGVRLVLLSVHSRTIHRVQCTSGGPSHTSTLKDKRERSPTLAYIHTKRQEHTSDSPPVYVCILFTKYGVLFVSIRLVVPSCTSTLKDKSLRLVVPQHTSALRDKSVRPV